jgi:hypothetical protein
VYNRYIRNESGAYERIRQPEAPPPYSPHAPPPPEPGQPQEPSPPAPPRRSSRPAEIRFLDRILSHLHLEDIDSGDLLLLLILFLLFREQADEELLIALGLLLIL